MHCINPYLDGSSVILIQFLSIWPQPLTVTMSLLNCQKSNRLFSRRSKLQVLARTLFGRQLNTLHDILFSLFRSLGINTFEECNWDLVSIVTAKCTLLIHNLGEKSLSIITKKWTLFACMSAHPHANKCV